MAELFDYVLEPLREGADFTLFCGRRRGDRTPVLGVALAGQQPSSEGLRRLEHEYSLAAELDPGWAAKPLALTRHEGRTLLILSDPGGELPCPASPCASSCRTHRPDAPAVDVQSTLHGWR
jgi:hypothetical protein